MAEVKRVAVVLLNLGGPDSLEAVEPFLFNLFKDPAILALPNPLRWLIAKLISHRRTPVARHIYSQIGGASPILRETRAQADALEKILVARKDAVLWRVEIAMRYWHPFADEAVDRVDAFGAEQIILLPLYPQYSGTTTGSSIGDWDLAAAARGMEAERTLVCCYPDQAAFIKAHIDGIANAIRTLGYGTEDNQPLHILLSAHGLPKRVIERGDPYQWQVERSSAAIIRGLEARGILGPRTEVVTCYQSRVGPLEWIGPATEEEIRRAGARGAVVVVVPIAFVSEHSETLVELDIEYRRLAEECGVRGYSRVPALAVNEDFIGGLADLVLTALDLGPAPHRAHSGMERPDACAQRFQSCQLCNSSAALRKEAS